MLLLRRCMLHAAYVRTDASRHTCESGLKTSVLIGVVKFISAFSGFALASEPLECLMPLRYATRSHAKASVSATCGMQRGPRSAPTNEARSSGAIQHRARPLRASIGCGLCAP
jgi:hypothetical protein